MKRCSENAKKNYKKISMVKCALKNVVLVFKLGFGNGVPVHL